MKRKRIAEGIKLRSIKFSIAEGTKLNNVKCVFQVSPAVASDPAAGKKQRGGG
jgi:hypothetical protein